LEVRRERESENLLIVKTLIRKRKSLVFIAVITFEKCGSRAFSQ